MNKTLFKKNRFPYFILFFILICLLAGCAGHQKQAHPATQQKFDDIGFWVKAFENPERDKWQKPDEVVKSLNLKPGDVVVDIGAGTGYFTRHFAVAVGPEGKAVGLDISPSMVKHMNEDAHKLNLKNYEARVVQTDDPGLEPNSVDVVFLCNTYHHIESRADYFRKISGALKANGRVVIVDFYVNTPVGPQEPGHKLAKETALKEMKQAGYRLLKSHDLLEYQYFLEFGL